MQVLLTCTADASMWRVACRDCMVSLLPEHVGSNLGCVIGRASVYQCVCLQVLLYYHVAWHAVTVRTPLVTVGSQALAAVPVVRLPAQADWLGLSLWSIQSTTVTELAVCKWIACSSQPRICLCCHVLAKLAVNCCQPSARDMHSISKCAPAQEACLGLEHQLAMTVAAASSANV